MSKKFKNKDTQNIFSENNKVDEQVLSEEFENTGNSPEISEEFQMEKKEKQTKKSGFKEKLIKLKNKIKALNEKTKMQILAGCCALFLILGCVCLTVFFKSGGITMLTANAENFSIVMSDEEHVFENIGDKYYISAYVEPSDEDFEIEFSSSNSDIVTVTSDGEMTAVKGGVAAVNAKCVIKGKEISGLCVVMVDVVPPPSEEAGAEDGVWTDIDTGYVPPIPAPQLDGDGFLKNDNIIGYYEMNPDTVAWVYVPGTNINVPVAQPPANDPEYYLNHGFNHYLKYSGSAFVDPNSKLSSYGSFAAMSDLNTVIYGHARGTDIFDQLERKLVLSSWYNKASNRYIYVNTMTEKSVWQITSAYYTDFDNRSNKDAVLKMNYTLTQEELKKRYPKETIEAMALLGQLEKMMQDSEAMANNANGWRNRIERSDRRYSPFANALSSRDWGGASVGKGDRLVTLVTCADSNSNVRFVVTAKLIRVKDVKSNQITEYGGK